MNASDVNRSLAAVRDLLLRCVLGVGVGLTVQACFTHPSIATAGEPALDVVSQANPARDASLRGLSVVSDRVAWASGSGGCVLRTADGGAVWKRVGPSNAVEIDFRDVHAFDANTAVVLSAGAPSRVYRTEDGGRRWRVAFEDARPESFYNAMDFRDARRGWAFGDPIDGRLLLIETNDGGQSWRQAPVDRRPSVGRAESGFAASGSCLRIAPDGAVFIGLGGKPASGEPAVARVAVRAPGRQAWRFIETPLPRSASAGVFSLAFWDARGVAVGGDYRRPELRDGVVAITEDRGQTWRGAHRASGPSGFRSAVAVARLGEAPVLVAVGPNGTDLSADGGRTWRRAEAPGFHAVAFSPEQAHVGWAVGSEGRIAKFVLTLNQEPRFGGKGVR